MKTTLVISFIVLILAGACSGGSPPPQTTPGLTVTQEAAMASIQLTSDAFAHEKPIPAQYTCTGSDISPALTWGEPPAGTQSFALIMDDPDAPMGTWVHWVLFNIPASARGLPEAVPAGQTLSDGSTHGRNSSGNQGYNGPCPPSGTHRYFFKLYALDEMLGILAGADKGELLKAMEGHLLAQGELMGTFSR
ncbi:MAG TPA: YbhB/YbcL family Raf kinase inhibitor-like protein [Anaerolineales bacterium]|nr:YbhB/YbcL family Raf kinase inhibitor-like protein [Anaerolineales bacterium]